MIALEPPFEGIVIEDNDHMVTAKRLVVTLDEPARVVTLCEAEGVRSEAHRLASPRARRHRIDLRGLLADTTYRCALSGGGGSGTLELHTDPLPEEMPRWQVVDGDPDAPASWTLFNSWITRLREDNQHKLVIVDREGRVRWYRFLDQSTQAGLEAALHPDGILAAGGHGYRPTVFDLDGEVLYQGPPAANLGKFHHDAFASDRRIVALAESRATDGVREWAGFRLEERDIDTDELLWWWDSQEAVDVGHLLPEPGRERDVYHANAIQEVDDRFGRAVLVSLAHRNQVIRVDRDSREIVWTIGSGGTFRLLDGPEGAGLPDAEWFFMPHDPEYRPDDDPPTLLVHDNGVGRPDGTRRSRVVEYQLDPDRRTAWPVWEYTEPGWYEELWGDADRLPGGNILVTSGHCDFCDDSVPARRSSLFEVRPDHTVSWRLTVAGERDGLYRAERIDGCALFDLVGACGP